MRLNRTIVETKSRENPVLMMNHKGMCAEDRAAEAREVNKKE